MDAALIVTLLAAGDYENPSIKKRIADLFSKTIYNFRELHYPVYTHYYTAQAMNFEGGRKWVEYYAGIRRYLLGSQILLSEREGYWSRLYRSHASSPPDRVYATAAACMILQMPYRYLPLLQYR
jgi:hypothetical protein